MIGSPDYPYGDGGCTSALDPTHCAYLRQCTSFALWRIVNDAHRPAPCWGNALLWAGAAARAGFIVNGDATRRDSEIVIECLQPGVNGAGWAGHVASVIGVDTRYPGTVNVEQYNWGNTCLYSQNQVRSAGAQFIHIPIVGWTPPTPTPTPTPVPTPVPPTVPPIPVPISGNVTLGLTLLAGAGAAAFYLARQRGTALHRGSNFGSSTVQIEHRSNAATSNRSTRPSAFGR